MKTYKKVLLRENTSSCCLNVLNEKIIILFLLSFICFFMIKSWQHIKKGIFCIFIHKFCLMPVIFFFFKNLENPNLTVFLIPITSDFSLVYFLYAARCLFVCLFVLISLLFLRLSVCILSRCGLLTGCLQGFVCGEQETIQ